MSIRLNHPDNSVTSTDTLSFIVEGGLPQQPRPIRFNASSVIMPVKSLPIGEKGSLVLDSASNTLKYHNGTNWVELLSKSDILAETNDQLVIINNKLNTKVDTVTYSSSLVPSAGISGTTLNIVFPLSTGNPTSTNGLYTTVRSGSIMQYSLISGQSISSIREQMGGSVGSQAGRNGTINSPYITQDGWCLSDGNYWIWKGPSVDITKQVPNLNRAAYLKGLSPTGITKTDNPVPASGTVNNTTITFPNHYHGTGMMGGLSGVASDDALLIFGKTWNDGKQYTGVNTPGDLQGREERAINGSNTQTALSTTDPIYPAGNNGSSHNHTLSDVDVNHFDVAILYNIAEPSTALPLEIANTLYVKKAGDSMMGPLNVLTPTELMHATTKQYVDGSIAGISSLYLKRSGDSMLGTLTVLTPTQPMHAATKQYVDDNLSDSYLKDIKLYGRGGFSGYNPAGTPIDYLVITIPPKNFARTLYLTGSAPCSLQPDGDFNSPRSAYVQMLHNGTVIYNRNLDIRGSQWTALFPEDVRGITLAANQTHVFTYRASCTERNFRYSKSIYTFAEPVPGYPITIETWKANSSGIVFDF